MLGTFSGGGLGFGVAFTLYDDFSRTANQIHASLNKLSYSTSAAHQKIESAINSVGVGTGLLAAGLGAIVPIGLGVQIAGEFEQAKFGLETLLKSKEAAEQMFADIKEDAATSSFGVEALLWVNRALVSTGLGAEQARKDTMNLANAIAAVGGSNDHLNRMAINMQQIRNIGKANGLDIKQFGYAGINIYKLLEETTGLHIDQLKEMDITYEQIATALEHAAAAGGMYHGALAKQAGSILGLVEQISDRIKYFGAAMGEAVMPVVRPLLNFLIVVFEKLAGFAETDIGRRIYQIVAAVAALLVAFGSLMVISGFLNIAVFKLSLMFNANTKVLILNAFAAGKTATAWRVLGTAMLSSLGKFMLAIAPIVLVGLALYKAWQYINDSSDSIKQLGYAILIILGPIGWLAGAVMGIITGLRTFDEYLEGVGQRVYGIAGFFQRLGGVIRGVQMIFETWGIAGDNTFALTHQMELALHSLGILETVIAIGTWIARIRSFISGMGEGIVFLVRTLKEMALIMVNAFMPVGNEFRTWEDLLARNTDSIDRWKEAGRIAGFVLGLAILGVTTYFFAMGVTALFALWPIIAVIAAVVVAVLALSVMVKVAVLAWNSLDEKTRETSRTFKEKLREMHDSMSEFSNGMDSMAYSAASSLGAGFGQMFSYLGNEFSYLAERAYDWGANFLTRFFDGIKSIGLGIADWFTNGPIGSALQGRVYSGGSGSETESGFSASPKRNRAAAGMGNMAKQKAEQFMMPPSMGSQAPAPTASSQPVQVNLIVDNETMFSKVIDLMNLSEGRV